jgi:hypothetical protein
LMNLYWDELGAGVVELMGAEAEELTTDEHR